jgi:hypothetical protein
MPIPNKVAAMIQPQVSSFAALDPEAQGDNGEMVVTAPGRTLTFQPSITASPTLALVPLVTGLKPWP